MSNDVDTTVLLACKSVDTRIPEQCTTSWRTTGGAHGRMGHSASIGTRQQTMQKNEYMTAAT